MFKKFLLLFVLSGFLYSCSSAAYTTVPQDQIKYSKVFEMKIKDSALFDQAARFAPSLVNSSGMDASKSVQMSMFGNYNKKSAKQIGINYSDKTSKIITGTGMVNVNYSFTPIETYYTVEIMIKENRMRIMFTNMENPGGLLTYQSQIDCFKEEADKIMDAFVSKINNRDDNF